LIDETSKKQSVYRSPITGMVHDSGSWLFDLTEEEWTQYRQKQQGTKSKPDSRPQQKRQSSVGGHRS